MQRIKVYCCRELILLNNAYIHLLQVCVCVPMCAYMYAANVSIILSGGNEFDISLFIDITNNA